MKRCETVYRVTFQTGEDPYLNSQFVIEYVSGMQGDPSTSGYLKTMTTCKHFAGFNLGTTIGEDGKFTQAQTFNASAGVSCLYHRSERRERYVQL